MKYNVHATVGKQKGKFIKQKKQIQITNALQGMKGKQGRRINFKNVQVSFKCLWYDISF